MIAWRSWAVIQAEPRTGSAMTRAGAGFSAVVAPILTISAPLEKIGLKSASAMFHYRLAASSPPGSSKGAGRQIRVALQLRQPIGLVFAQNVSCRDFHAGQL